MTAISKLAGFLTSLWGLLAAGTILFPGAAAMLKVPMAVQNSKIASLYPVFGSVIAAFAFLFLTVYREKLIPLESARRVALVAFGIALIGLFSYVGIKTFALDVDYVKERIDQNRNVIVVEGKSRGVIMDKESRHSELAPTPTTFAYERGDPWDLACLLAFIVMFSGLTVAFGALGLHFYQARRDDL